VFANAPAPKAVSDLGLKCPIFNCFRFKEFWCRLGILWNPVEVGGFYQLRFYLQPMPVLLLAILAALRSGFRNRTAMQLEILALRHQIGVLQRAAPRPRLGQADRVFWVWLSRLWSNWQSALAIVKPQTVIGWHRRGFRLYWHWKSRPGKPGRPHLSAEVRDLIRTMSAANPLWGAPRIHGELLKLGLDVSQATVARYMVRHRRPPSQTWRTFLKNHVPQMASMDFLVVPTVTFRLLYVLVILSHDRRRVVHFNVTACPTAEWTAQQVIEAFPWDSAPRYLIRDRDQRYGHRFREQLSGMGTTEVLTAFRSPWQNACSAHPPEMPRSRSRLR
jgi:hypothetical protein